MSKVSLQSVTLDLPIYSAHSRSFKNAVLSAGTGARINAPQDSTVTIRALDNVSVELDDGDRLGLIGTNGAGKSTLMRVIAGIYHPTLGHVSVSGTIGTLFDMSLGMDMEATGYDNIRIRGLMLGISGRNIEKLVPSIEDLTELGEYLNMPLRTYSAGMAARLAFAISTAIRPEVLLMDEGIGAGDAHFMHKVARHIEALLRSAGIVVLASHDDHLVRQFCNKAIIMHRGRASNILQVEDAIAAYYKMVEAADSEMPIELP